MHRKIEEKEIKDIATEILKQFDYICRKYDLKYSIAYGTLIGAVRHKGFIPWDDDIDVIMPREDYEKLLKLKYDDGEYEIKNYRYTKGYYYIFSKMISKRTYIKELNRREKDMGIFIDIFPIDYIGNDEETIQKKIKRSLKYKKLVDSLGSTTNRENSKNLMEYIVKKVIKMIAFPFTKVILRYLDFSCINEKCLYSKQLTYTPIRYGCFLSEYWNDLIEIEFEKKKVKAFKEYDAYLKGIYGDYMKLPPKEKQISNHNFYAYKKF